MRKLCVVAVMLGASIASANPRVTLGVPVARGPLAAKAISVVVKKNHAALLACYKKRLGPAKSSLQQPPLEIDVDVTFTIHPDGKVTGLSSSGVDSELEICVRQTISRLRFLRKEIATEVTFPLSFTTDPQPAASKPKVYDRIPEGTVGELSVFGTGSGGGGTGYGTIGTGRYGSGKGGFGTRSSADIGRRVSLVVGQPSTSGPGELDEAIIRRYIKRNFQKLAYCYEKELVHKPTIEGTLTAEFTIDKTGLVPSVKATGVDPNVETCVAGVIKAIEFPRPKNDGEVHVAYPLTFSKPEPPKPSKATKPTR